MKTGLTLEEAQTAILLNRVPLGTQVLPLKKALGRTLAADVAAPLDQPPLTAPLWTATPSAPPTWRGRTGTTPPCWRWWTRCMPGTKPESPWAPVRRCAS